MCAKYKYKPYNIIERPNFEENLSFEKKCLNVGLLRLLTQEKRTTLNKIDVFLSKLHDICPKYLYNNIINKSLKPCPSSTRIKKLINQKHALYGRWFDTVMLYHDVSNCDCCGICINHDDNLLEKEIII